MFFLFIGNLKISSTPFFFGTWKLLKMKVKVWHTLSKLVLAKPSPKTKKPWGTRVCFDSSWEENISIKWWAEFYLVVFWWKVRQDTLKTLELLDREIGCFQCLGDTHKIMISRLWQHSHNKWQMLEMRKSSDRET